MTSTKIKNKYYLSIYINIYITVDNEESYKQVYEKKEKGLGYE